METTLVVPIAAPNLDQAKRQITTAASAGAQALELRTDYLENLAPALVKELINQAASIAPSLRIIVTCRDKRQGGEIEYPRQRRIDVLLVAIQAGADFIDLEYENFLNAESRKIILQQLSQHPKTRLILSTHNFEEKFDDIGKVYREIATARPAAVPKLVYTANHINDCFDALDLLHETSGERVIFCMGEAGLITRILAKKLAGFVTFASLDQKTATAPGQLTIDQFKTLYRYDSINSETELFGVMGSPIAHSLSPAIHNACFADAGLNKLYLPLLVGGGRQEFGRFMNGVLDRQWLGFRGLSVTIPHKENALNYVKENHGFIEPLAERIGAVNTILISAAGKLSAYNTDYAGALDAITAGMAMTRADLKDLPVAIIGAGGVARAIVAGLSDCGAKVKIYNRTVEKAQKLAKEFNCDYAGLDDLANLQGKLVINCTSIGMYPNVNATLLPEKYIRQDMTVFDTVYNPAETLLLKLAKQAGAKTITGLDMFINQAAVQFKLFAGHDTNRHLAQRVAFDYIHGLDAV